MADIITHGKRFYPEPTVAFPRLTKPASPVKCSLPPLNLTPLSPPFNLNFAQNASSPATTCALPVTPRRNSTPRGPITPPPSVLPSFKVYQTPSTPTPMPRAIPLPAMPTQSEMSGLPAIPQIAQYMVQNRVPVSQISSQLPQQLPLDMCKSSKDLIEVSKLFSCDLPQADISQILDLRDIVFERGGVYVFTLEQFVQFYSFYNMFLTEERSWDPRLSEKFAGSSRTRLRCSCRFSPRLAKRARTVEPARQCSAAYNMSFWPQQKLVVWECIGVANHSMRVNASIGTCQYLENLTHRLQEFSLDDISVMVKTQLSSQSKRLWLDLFDTDRVRALLRNSDDCAARKEPNLQTDLQLAATLAQRYAQPDIDARLVDLKTCQALFLSHKDAFREIFQSSTLTLSVRFKVCIHFESIALLTLTTGYGRHGISVFLPLSEVNFKPMLHRVLHEIESIGCEMFGPVSLDAQTMQVSVEQPRHHAPLPWNQVLQEYNPHWSVVLGRFDTCFDGQNYLPFTFKHSMAGTVLQFVTWLTQNSLFKPKVKHLSLSMLCSPPASEL